MAGEGEKGSDFYAVLGLEKNCSALELKNAYKKLALKWHPDRSIASGNPKTIEEAKKNFQAVQEAYSVLSDENKRFLYDVGVYNHDDDDENDMGDFLGELAVMMSQTKPSTQEDTQQSFEELQNLFQEMFEKDEQYYGSASESPFLNNSTNNMYPCPSYNNNFNSNKRNCSSMSSEKTEVDFDMGSLDFSQFCMGMEGGNMNSKGVRGTGRRTGRKQKLSSRKDTSSHDAKGR